MQLIASIDQAHATSLISYSLGIGNPIPPVLPVRLLLMTANGSWLTPGTELGPGGGYVPGTGIVPATFTITGPGTVVNAMPLTQKSMPGCVIAGGELWDSSTGLRRLWLGPLDVPMPVNPGDTFTVPAGSLVLKIGAP